MTDHNHNHGLNMIDHDLNMTGHEDIRALQADFRAAVVKAITGAGDDPEHPETVKQIKYLEKEYANHLEQTGIYISGKNDISGFRQVVFLGPGLSCPRINGGKGYPGVIAITLDGRLVTGEIRPRNPYNEKPVTTVQAIEALVDLHQSEQEFINDSIHFYLDYRTNYERNNYFKMTVSLGKFNFFLDHYGHIEYGARTEIKRYLFQQTWDRLAPVRCAILNALDKNVLHDLQKYDLIHISDGSWLTGGDGDGITEDVIMARQQAVRAYPLLSEIFRHDYVLCNTIDGKTSLSKAIADYFNVEERKVKRISGMTWQQTGSVSQPLESLHFMISDFLDLPDKCFPKTVEQFQHLDILKEFACNVYGESLIEFTEHLSKNENPWQLIDRMKQVSGSYVIDAVNFLVQKLLVPAMIADGEIPGDTLEKTGRDEILKHFKVKELLDWSDRYHRNIARYEDRLEFISVKQDWPGMLGTIDLGNGCRARELTSSVALKTQGRAEDHCVGGYVSTILDREGHSKGQAVLIFSLEQDDRILSTVEIICFLKCSAEDECKQDECEEEQIEQDKKYYLHTKILQNEARSNKSPSCMARDLAEQVAARLREAGPETFLTYLDQLHDTCVEQERTSGFESYMVNCGFDPHNRAHFEKVWDELAVALPNRFRKYGLKSFIANRLSQASCQTPSSKNAIWSSGLHYPCRRAAGNATGRTTKRATKCTTERTTERAVGKEP